jgi:carbamoyl-phosphate synthase small subunit
VNMEIMKAVLGLEDGNYVVGEGFGVEGECSGELVFNTLMSGYMEALSDPSYYGQILMFTFPMIGNYGTDVQNMQSPQVKALGAVCREICEKPDVTPTIRTYFEENNLLGICGVDTRMLTIKTRVEGTLRAALVTGDDNPEHAIELAKKTLPISDCDLIPAVSCREPYHIPGTGKKIAILDLGLKTNMLSSLSRRNGDLYVFPHNVQPRDIFTIEPDCLFITNGPGDPKTARLTIATVKKCIGELPIFGICMGNQITALALGGDTYKLKFGHRGSNQPVRYKDGRIFITTQNHGFAVDGDSLPEGSKVTFVNANDKTVEGFESEDLNISCVQFHPEAHAGPLDTECHYFDGLFRRLE